MKRLTFILLITLLSFKLQAACSVMTVAGAEQWRPYAYTEMHGKMVEKGIAFDVIKLLGQDLGIQIEPQLGLPWKRIEAKLDSGEIDLLAGHYWTEKRAEKWLVTSSFAQETVHLVMHEQTRFEFSSFRDLRGKSGVVPRGISLGKDFDTYRERLSILEVRNHEQMYEMLRLKRVDFLVSPLFAAKRHLEQPKNSKLQVLFPAINRYDVHFSLSPKSACASVYPELNAAIAARIADGSIQQIAEGYYLAPHSIPPISD